MARSRIYRSPYHNPPPSSKNELVGGPLRVSTKGSNSYTPTPALAPSSTNELFKQFMKTYLEAETRPAQPKPREKLLKACFSDFY